MKALIGTIVLLLSVNTHARSMKLATVCGSLTRMNCVKKPCPEAYVLITKDAKYVMLDKETSTREVYARAKKLGAQKDICVSGLYQDINKSSISVLLVEAAPSVDTSKFRCVQQINCMPPTFGDAALLCSEDFAKWSEENCGGRPSRLD